MKTLYIVLLTFGLFFNSCQSQVLPINTGLNSIPQGAYLKDLNNELPPYIGTYKATYEGNEITLFITFESDKFKKSTKKTYFLDTLIIKYIVKNLSTNQILQDTYNFNTPISLYSFWTLPAQNTVAFSYSGTNCGVGWGTIRLKKLNTTQIQWDYRPNSTSFREGQCNGNQDLTIYLPVTRNLVFTKV